MSHYYLACRIGREWYGISIDRVSEVIHILALRQLPKSEMVGVMTLRENVVPVVDLRQILGIEDYSYAMDTPIIALRADEKWLGLIVDEADDVLLLPDASIQPYSEALVQGMARLGDRLLFILNVEDLLRHFLEAKAEAHV